MTLGKRTGLGRGSCDRLKGFVRSLLGGADPESQTIDKEYQRLRDSGAIPSVYNPVTKKYDPIPFYDPSPERPRVFT